MSFISHLLQLINGIWGTVAVGFFAEPTLMLRVYKDATHFGAFENWMNDTLWSFETRILAKANQAMAIDSIDQIGIFNQADFLKQKYKWVYAVFGALESDTSIYAKVRAELITRS